jgi:hypothetical protein
MSGWVAGAAVVGSVISSNANRSAASQAADTAAQASDRSAALQYQMFQEQNALQAPWREAGVNALGQMRQQYANMPAAFTGQVNLGEDPGYAFRLSEGQKALDRQAAMRGGLISGSALKAAQRYGQEMGSQEYGNAYQRALTNYNASVNRENLGYNRLASMSGTGQTTAGNLATQAGNYGANVGSIYQQQGINQGNALLAGTRAQTSMYGDIANLAGRYLAQPTNAYKTPITNFD